MNEPRIKGLSILHLREFVQEKHGDKALRALTRELPANLANLLHTCNAFEWFPLAEFVELETRVVDALYRGDISKAQLFGSYDLDRSVRSVYKILLRMLEPDFLVKRASRLFSALVDQGGLEVDEAGPNRVQLRFVGLRSPHEVWCWDARGAILGSLHACCARNAVVRHEQCVHHGAGPCAFQVSWMR